MTAKCSKLKSERQANKEIKKIILVNRFILVFIRIRGVFADYVTLAFQKSSIHHP